MTVLRDEYTETYPHWADGLSLLPDNATGDALLRYILHRIPPGGFLTAVLSNNLMSAMRRADGENRVRIYDICAFLHNYAPSSCWGSPDLFHAWIEGDS